MDPKHAGRPSASGRLHNGYSFSLAAKGLLGLSQLISGLALAITPDGALTGLANWLIHLELAEDPTDPLATWASTMLAASPIHVGAFYPIYLVVHGVLNLGLVLALLARFRWAFPVSILALVAFIAYQLYKFALSGSPMMIVLSVIDAVVIWLIWREYRLVLSHERPVAPARPNQD